MAHVRETIKLLSKILLQNGTIEISPEMFRQAKFNKKEAAPVLWKLMFQLVYFCNFGIIDESAVKAETELTQEERCVYVKQELQKWGYLLPDFACLSPDGNTGSRELLLALAWLICKEDIMEKFMNNCTSPIEYDSDLLFEEEMKFMPSVKKCDIKEPSCKVQKLLMLNGKLQLNLRRLYSLQIQDINLSHKVHESTKGVSMTSYRNHLTPMEVRLLRYPAHLKKMLHLLEKDNERIQNLLLWKDQEHIFWHWMESVLELKLSEEDTSTSYRSIPVYLNLPSDCNEKINSTRQHLVETILQYEDIIDQLENLWTRKHEDISEQDLDNLLTSINMEIALQRANLSLSATETMLKPPKQTRFILQDKTKKTAARQSKHLAPAFSIGQGDGQSVDINVAIVDIERRIENLEHDLLVDQGICKTEVENLASKIPDTICIPPLAFKRRF
ncbi:hypothetical protein SNE40_009230 [Patella caerulea]|uniref:Tubulin epsilon and delta complex protein 1 domain-containing protein n=1 Tax=Patella caerulea TaxID=87958 RepID=A0AAN8PQ53_PATCE